MTHDRPEGSSGDSSDPGAPRRPTPVRELMEAAEKEESASASDGTPEEAVRTMSVDGEEWIVRVEGSARSGRGSDTGAPLLLLTFTRSETEGRSGGERGEDGSREPEREALAVGDSLDGLSHDALEELLSRSRPYRGRSA